MTDYLGWIATAVFVSSYFFKRPAWLRAAQMLGASLWIVYGVLISAIPVVVANGLVFAAAAWTLIPRGVRLSPRTRPAAEGTGRASC